MLDNKDPIKSQQFKCHIEIADELNFIGLLSF